MPAARSRGKRGPEVPVREPAEAPRKKNYRLRQSKIDRAMEILGTRTETETIEQALDSIALRDRLVDGVRGMRGAGLTDVFDESP